MARLERRGGGRGHPALTHPDGRRGPRLGSRSCRRCGARPSDAGRHAIAEALFERIDVLGANDFTFALTAHARARGRDAAFGAGVVRVKEGQSGRGERTWARGTYLIGKGAVDPVRHGQGRRPHVVRACDLAGPGWGEPHDERDQP